MSEIWKPIKGYEGLYEVSNKGRIKSLKRYTNSKNEFGNIKQNHNEKILKNNTMKTGYVMTTLYKEGKPKSFFIHRLVAEAFLENPYLLPQVNHIDGNKSNNYVSNLEYVTNSENQKHAYDTGLKNAQRVYESNRKPVRCITTGKEFDSIKEAALYYNIKSNSKICNCCNHKQKYAGKYNGQKLVWEYI